MKKILLLVLPMAFLSFVTAAQIKNLAVGFSVNKAWIPGVSNDQTLQSPLPSPYAGYFAFYRTYTTVRQSFDEKTGFNFKSSFDYGISKKFFLTTGLTFSYTRYQAHNIVEGLQPVQWDLNLCSTCFRDNTSPVYDYGYQVGSPYGNLSPGGYRFKDLIPPVIIISDSETKEIGKTTFISLQVPMLVGTSFLKNRLSTRIGAVTSFILHASTYQWEALKAEKKTATNDFTPVSAGAMLQANYNITSRISVEISGQHFFSSLYKNPEGEKAKLNLLSAGLSYKLR
jgi:hypothetical protein